MSFVTAHVCPLFQRSKCYCYSGWSTKYLRIDWAGFVQLDIPLCHAGLRGCGFHVLQYCHRAVKGSVSSAPSCLLLLTQGIQRVMSTATNSSVIWFLVNGCHSGELIEADLVPGQALAVLSLSWCLTCLFLLLFFRCFESVYALALMK